MPGVTGSSPVSSTISGAGLREAPRLCFSSGAEMVLAGPGHVAPRARRRLAFVTAPRLPLAVDIRLQPLSRRQPRDQAENVPHGRQPLGRGADDDLNGTVEARHRFIEFNVPRIR